MGKQLQSRDHSSKTFLEKEQQARAVIDACRTETGFVASTQSYRQLWLRDLVYSEDALLRFWVRSGCRESFVGIHQVSTHMRANSNCN